MMKNNLRKVADMTVTALVHHLTPTVVEALPELGYKPTGEGIFQRDSDMVSHLIVFEDLPDESTPEELQAFSNPARRQTVILSELEKGRSTPILEAILELYESEVLKLMAIKQETIKRFIENLGQEKILATFRKEDLLKTLSKDDLLAAFTKEDVISAFGAEEILKSLQAKLGPEQLRKMIDQLNGNKSESH